MQIPTESVKYRFDFLKYRYVWLAVSVIYLVIGLAAYFIRGGFNYHIDFTGGAELRVSFEKEMDTAQLRSTLSSKGWKDAVIQNVGTTNREFLVRVGALTPETETKIKRDLQEGVAGNKATIDSIQWVSAEVGKDITWNALIAIALALLILLLYIAVRFEFRFGVGAVAAMVHDILAILVFLVITGEPVSLHVLASVLAILGYSINDTIVIFSRIRENFVKLRGVSDYEIANLSINQTLSRTLLTSGATLLSVLAILFLGGEALRGMALVILVGIIVGTYSSIYIASPVMLAINKSSKFKF